MSTQPTNEQMAKEIVKSLLDGLVDTSATDVSEMLWDKYSMPDDEADERLGDILEHVTAMLKEVTWYL